MQKTQNLENVRLEEYTTPSPCSVKESASIKSVIKLMEDREIRHLPVLNDKGEAIGIISDRDVAVLKSFAFNADVQAKDLMTSDPVSANVNASLLDAVYLMSSKKIGSIIVNDDGGELYGIFTSTDALNALIDVLRGDVEDDG